MDKNNDEDLILINLINSNGESINSNFNLNNANIVLFIRNYKDYSTYIANQSNFFLYIYFFLKKIYYFLFLLLLLIHSITLTFSFI